MIQVSVVIITKNEADVIARCIERSRLITDDVVVVDSGSTDETAEMATNYGCRLIRTEWDGYGANKNKGITAAKYDWILSIDADEVPDNVLIKSILKLKDPDPAIVYDVRFCSYMGKKPVRFGSWGRDHHVRLFNRRYVKWSETVVHETLLLPQRVQVKKLEGRVHHYSVKDIDEYDNKGGYYAKLSAKKYLAEGKKAGIVKLYISPLFGFLKNYIVYLGFLDGAEGWAIAKSTLKNTRRKYFYLSQMENMPAPRPLVKDNAVKDSLVKDNLAVEY